MVYRSKLAVPAIALATGAFLLAGCGSSNSSAASNTLLGKVKSSKQLIIAESAFAPEDFQNTQTKQWTGYDVNILKGFAKTLGAKLKVDPLPFSSGITAVAEKRADITIDIYWSSSRAKVLSFSRPMLNYNDAVVVNSQHPTIASDTVSAMRGKTIGVVTASAEVAEGKALARKVGAKLVYYPSIAEAFLALSTGRIDATLQPDTDPAWSKKTNPSLHIKILGPVPTSIAPPIASLRGYYAVPKGQYSASFLKKLNAYLLKIDKNGQEQKILDKYGMKSSIYLKGLASVPNNSH